MNNSEATLENIPDWYNKWTLDQFSKYLNGDILEVGSGIGNFTRMLSDFGTVTSLDVDPGYIDKTKALVGDRVKVGLGDIEAGRYFFDIKQKFDTIICLNVLEHIKDDDKALRNLTQLLKDGAYLVLLVPIHKFLFGEIDKSIGHFRRYDQDSIKKSIADRGLKIELTRRLNFLGALGWFIAGRVLKQRKVAKGNMKIFNAIVWPFMLLEKFMEPPFGTSLLIVAKKA